MGSGIAQVSAQAGWDVVLRDVTDEALTRGTDGIKASYEKFVSKGKLDAEAAQDALGRITATTDLDAVADADIVVEAVFEKLDVKHEIGANPQGLGWPTSKEDSRGAQYWRRQSQSTGTNIVVDTWYGINMFNNISSNQGKLFPFKKIKLDAAGAMIGVSPGAAW